VVWLTFSRESFEDLSLSPNIVLEPDVARFLLEGLGGVLAEASLKPDLRFRALPAPSNPKPDSLDNSSSVWSLDIVLLRRSSWVKGRDWLLSLSLSVLSPVERAMPSATKFSCGEYSSGVEGNSSSVLFRKVK